MRFATSRHLLLILFAFWIAACANADPVATAPDTSGSFDLSGLAFEVHQEPG